jgi:hypothetical protein
MLTHFIVQLLSHTPLYVWAILAFLVYRGTAAMRDREVEFRKLCIIPLVMLGLSLQDMSAKFGLDGLAHDQQQGRQRRTGPSRQRQAIQAELGRHVLQRQPQHHQRDDA